MFLRDKLYSDFRTNFDVGLLAILEGIARVTSDSLARVETPEWHVDWSIDWGDDKENETLFVHITAIEQTTEQPYSVLTQIHIDAKPVATERYYEMRKSGLDWVERSAIIEMLESAATEKDLRFRLEDEKPQTAALILTDTKSPAAFHVQISLRRLGQDTGRDILLDIGGQLRALRAAQKDIDRELTPSCMKQQDPHPELPE